MIIEISSGAEADLADGNTMLIDQSLLDDIAAAFPLEPIPSEDDITRCTYDPIFSMKLIPTVGSNSILFGAKHDEVIRVFGNPDLEVVLNDIKSHPKGRRSLKYGEFSLTIGSTIGLFGMRTSIRTAPVFLWETEINDFASSQFTDLLASKGASFEISPLTAWGSSDIFSADNGILAYFESDRISSIQISVPYSCPSQY